MVLREPFSAWLRNREGDGILARIDDRRMARLFRDKNLPLIDLRGRLPGLGIPVVDLDNRPVARRCGFRNAKYFGDVFRRVAGMPPGEFRRQRALSQFQD
jgi:hypothetical protein